ncbi:MAG TPA: hypothetical protein VNQ76_04510 [Planctomicrobium sp.]|nr:hypothetical protein [Planctomicrobium sp.]
MLKTSVRIFIAIAAIAGSVFLDEPLSGGELYVGAATVSITPDRPVPLFGGRTIPIARRIGSPCTATALVIETRNGETSLETALFVSCDLVWIRGGAEKDLYELVRDQLRGRVPEILLDRLILNATHTHSAPPPNDINFNQYRLPDDAGDDVMLPAEYREFLVERLAKIVEEAWIQRAPAQVAWGLGHAVVAQNRRVVFADGSAVMYGNTSQPHFRAIEGYEDHGLEILYFWDRDDKLIATAINIACPAQAGGVGGVNADLWHPVREMLRERHGEDLFVIAWIGASGDMTPRPLYRKAAEERMQKLRKLNASQEAARRIVTAWEDVYQVIRNEKKKDVELEFRSTTVSLPHRQITSKEGDAARKLVARLKDSNKPTEVWDRARAERTIRRYEEQQQKGSGSYEMPLRTVRLGDIAIVTNDVELFTDFGVQMKARSPALQTFVIQLCGGGTYLPTKRAVSGGGYSAIPESNIVGPEGGQVLVDESVKLIKSLWPSEKNKNP